MQRLNAYTRPGPNNTVTVDVEGMVVDLVTILKASGHSKAELDSMVEKIWSNVKVEISTSRVTKQ